MRNGQKPETIDDYLAEVPEPARATLQKVRAIIEATVPVGTTQGISYGIPTYKYLGMLLGFGAFRDHCSLFAMNPGVRDLFVKELSGYDVSKGTIRFALDKPLPAGLLKKLVKARVAQNVEKKQVLKTGSTQTAGTGQKP